MSDEKAVAKRGATSVQTGGASAPPAVKTLRDMLEGDVFKAQVARALPKHLKADRFIRIACTAIMRTPKLQQCEQVSFFNSLLTLSQLGIEPDGRRAHLIPFENRKRGVVECQLIIDYKGLVELAMRTGQVSYIHADVICDNDVFEYDKGEIKQHKIDFKKPRGKVYATYAICRFKDGTEKAEVMPMEEIVAIQKRSKAGNCGPWMTDFNEMAKKTVFRRLSKWITLSPEYRDALEHDADTLPTLGTVLTDPLKPVPRLFDQPAGQLPTGEPGEPLNPDEVIPPSAEGAGTPTDEVGTVDKIVVTITEANVSEGKLITILRQDGVLTNMQRLEDLTPEQAAIVLKTIDAYIGRIRKEV